MLELQELSKTFDGPSGGVRALAGVSLEIARGEFVAVRGPSGCGKSTLLLMAGALLRPDAGRVMLDGQDVYALGAEQRAGLRASRIGFVFQQFHLVPYLSVIENVMAPSLTVRVDGALSRAEELIGRLGLKGRKDHRPSQLSTGERQRAALARAMLNRPGLLLADEPTGNLDPANAQIVLDSLAAFAAEGGAVLLVTHDPHAAQRAGRIVFMDRGEITVQGEAQLASE